MRRFLLGFLAVGLVTLVGVGCGNSEGNDDGGGATAGQSTSGASGSSSAGKGGSSSGGSSSGSAGVPSGGSAAGGSDSADTSSGGTGTSDGGEPASGGAGADGLVDCDTRKVLCKVVQPECPPNEAPSVEGSCYGPCVPVVQCACKAAAECPNQNEYTCWMQTHCGPFVR